MYVTLRWAAQQVSRTKGGGFMGRESQKLFRPTIPLATDSAGNLRGALGALAEGGDAVALIDATDRVPARSLELRAGSRGLGGRSHAICRWKPRWRLRDEHELPEWL